MAADILPPVAPSLDSNPEADLDPEPDLNAPFQTDRLLEVRTSPMKPMAGLKVQSGIDKKICPEPMRIEKLGLTGDEHDPTFHGGPDKAILGYCSSHYPSWRKSYPDRTDRFVPGGFGENFVTRHMNERNVCIGDVIAVGPDVILQVSLPRNPCFKLNHRFALKNFAPQTYLTSRTGWYYRVLQEGVVRAGDELRLVERRWPRWTIERVQEYLWRDTMNDAMNEELAQIEAMGEESRGQFRKRAAQAAARKRRKTTNADSEEEENKKEKVVEWREFKVVRKRHETPRIVSLLLDAVHPDQDSEEVNVTGSHARIKLPNGLVRSYSLVSGAGSDPRSSNAANGFEIAVARDANSRGGSTYIHDSLDVGHILHVGGVTTALKPNSGASKHVYIIGGIGITAFLFGMDRNHRANLAFEVHYAVRSAEDVPFQERLKPFWHNVVLYDKSKGQRMDIGAVVKARSWNNQFYVCGPDRMMEEAKNVMEQQGVGPDEVHYEAFSADISGDPFDVVVYAADDDDNNDKTNNNKSEEKTQEENGDRDNAENTRDKNGETKGRRLHVSEDESLLQVLQRHYPSVLSSCEVGNCGTCVVKLRSGKVDHRGTALLPEEQETSLLSCVSRGIGEIAIEI